MLENSVKLILIDLSGTLHIGDKPIPNAIQSLQRLRSLKVPLKFVTNTTKESRQCLYNRLTKIGFSLQPEEIVSSLGAARRFITSRNLKPMLLVAPEAMEDFTGLEPKVDEKPTAVVVGLAPTEFTYGRLNEAFRAILDGAQLIAIHAGKYYNSGDGLSLGPGCFVRGLEYSAQCTATLIGKPSANFFLSALEGVAPKDAVMIGDDVVDDIEGAMKVGMKGFLVQTGKYREGDEAKIQPGPSETVPSFAEAVSRIEEAFKGTRKENYIVKAAEIETTISQALLDIGVQLTFRASSGVTLKWYNETWCN